MERAESDLGGETITTGLLSPGTVGSGLFSDEFRKDRDASREFEFREDDLLAIWSIFRQLKSTLAKAGAKIHPVKAI